MITVSIAINGVVIQARSAVNTGRADPATGRTIYRVDDGGEVLHLPSDGAKALAMLLLDRIVDPGVTAPRPVECTECRAEIPAWAEDPENKYHETTCSRYASGRS